eukprot:TRINITY_DN4151_c0_g5_i1.p1 TRINITY_DN4151_c0_g5~~TRINITY_DN4151_c0_g5_i1.p1  ORF type:complete len:382 (+),score=133.22 TRINITY_DN4151_c0_g5_i1:77-1147(+)
MASAIHALAAAQDRSGWPERAALLAAHAGALGAARGTAEKGLAVFAARKAADAGAEVLREVPVATARDLPLPELGQYCGECGGDVPPQDPQLVCGECGIGFCSAECVGRAGSTWHHAGKHGLCSADLNSLLHTLSDQIKQAYYLALFSGAAAGGAGEQEDEDGEGEEEEEGMGAPELKVMMEVYTDCILSLKLLSSLAAVDCVDAGLHRTWVRGLSASQREKGAAIVENFVENVSECIVGGVDEEAFALAYDLCVTNSWPGDGARHIFAAHSLLNHSCAHNAKCVMRPRGVVQVVTTAPVKEGEELCIDYTDGNEPATLSKEAREDLFLQWGHKCLCTVCVDAAATECGAACMAKE